MNFLNLEYFVVAAEEMNFTKAAKKLYISQQSLSSHISKLESFYGVSLFDRNPPMTLTEAGQSLLRNAKKILSDKTETERELQDIRDFKNATLTIGVPRTRGAVLLPPILTRFYEEFPQVKIILVEGTSNAITDALYRGEVDFTLGFEIEDEERVNTEILQEEHTLIVVPDNLLQKYYSEEERNIILTNKLLPLQAFSRCPMIKMKHSNWLGEIFENSCADGNFQANIILETVSIATMVALCSSGYGVILCPSVFVDKHQYLPPEQQKQIHRFILDFPNAHKMIAVNYLRNKYLSIAAKKFIAMAKDVLSS